MNNTFKCGCTTCEYLKTTGLPQDDDHVAPFPTCPSECHHHVKHDVKQGRTFIHHRSDDGHFCDAGTYRLIATRIEPWQHSNPYEILVLNADGTGTREYEGEPDTCEDLEEQGYGWDVIGEMPEHVKIVKIA